MPDITISGGESFNIAVDGSPIPVYLGENTALAAQYAADAADQVALGALEADRAEAAAIAAESIIGNPTRIVGVETPASTPAQLAGGFTNGVIAPAEVTQQLTEIEFFAPAAMTSVVFRVWTPQPDGTYARKSSFTPAAVVTGTNVFSAPADFSPLTIEKGDIVTWYPVGAGFYYTDGATLSGAFYHAGDPDTMQKVNVVDVQFTTPQVRLTFTDLPIVNPQTVSDIRESLNSLVKQPTIERFGLVSGDAGTLSAAAAANTIYFWNEPVSFSGTIKAISGHFGASGTVNIWAMGRDAGVGRRKRMIGTVTIPSSGVVSLTDADFGVLEVAGGDYLGMESSASVLRVDFSQFAKHGGWNAMAASQSFVDASPTSATGELQIGISVEQAKPVTAKIVTQAEHDALTTAERRGNDMVYGVPGHRLFIGDTEILANPTTPVAKIVWSGDSTSAAFEGNAATAALITGVDENVIAVPGDPIANQLFYWNALSPKTGYDAIVVQIGLNDVGQGDTGASIIAELQAFINTIATGAPDADIVIVQMTPARGQWAAIFPGDNGAAAQTAWDQVNAAIAGTGPSPITGVDARVTAHVAELSATGPLGGSYLAEQYKTDLIHPNEDGRRRVAVAVRAALTTLGHLPA